MDGGLIAMRMRLSGGKQVAAEAEIADAAIEKTAATTEAAGKRATRASNGIRSSLTRQIASMRSIGRSLTTHVTLPILAVAAVSGKFALDFDRNMRNVNSIAQLPQRQFEQLKQSVLDLAGPTAQAPNTLAEGLYDLVSSGFDAHDALRVLQKSALAATAGLTTTEVATKAVAAVLNAYHLPARRAGQVSDQLFETVNRGVLTFEELASQIGDVLPFAAQLGVGLDQIGAAVSTMTKAGISAPETMTRIKNVLVTLLKPGKELSKVFEGLGTTGEELVRKQGLQGALETILGQTDGSKQAVAELFPNIRALGGVLALTGINAKSAGKDLAAFAETTGATQRALSQQEKSFGLQLQRAWASLQAVLIEIGAEVLPLVIPPFLHLVGMARDAIKWFSDLPEPIKRMGGELAVLAALAGPLLYLAGSIGKVVLTMKELGVVGGGAGIAGLSKGRLAGGAAGIAAGLGGQAIGGKGGEAVSNIGGLAGMGFAVGGPWGAGIGAAAGAALTFGPDLLALFETEKKMNPLQEKLASSAHGMADAFKAARAQVRTLKASEDAVDRTRRRHKAATAAVEQAQNALNAARRRAGPNSQAAINAEVRYSRAIRGVTAARKAQDRAERQHGAELRTTKELLRFATLEERHRINVLRTARRELQARKNAMQADGATLQQLQPINEKLSKNSDQLRQAQKRQAETMLEASKVAGGKYASFLRNASRSSIEYGSKVKATRERLRELKSTLGEVTRAIERTAHTFEGAQLETQGMTLRESIQRAESELGRGGGAPHGGRRRGAADRQPPSAGRRNTRAEPAAGSSALHQLLYQRPKRQAQPPIVVKTYLNKRQIAEAVVEEQDADDARA